MKQILLIIPSLLICFLSFGQEIWTIDNPHSNVRFEVGWEDFSMRTGEFKIFDGTIETESRDDLSNAVFTFKVETSSVDVIADRLADHIKSDRFLDVENYPEITFRSSEVKRTSDSIYIASGKLNIRGVEKDQDVSIWVKGYKETRRGYIFGIEVSLSVPRTDFGLEWGSPRLANNILIVGHLLYKMKVEEDE